MNLNIHRVEKVNFGKVKKGVVEKTGRVYYNRNININFEGKHFELSLYSDNPKDLKQIK